MASTRQPLSRAIARSHSSLYVCKSCRSQLSQPRITTIQQARHASNEDIPFTEKVRRKIWGTDNPPGLADPYGGPSFLEKRAMRRKAARLAQQEQDTEQYQEEATAQRPSPRQRLQPEEIEQAEVGEESYADSVDAASMRDLPPMEKYVPADSIKGLEEAGYKEAWSNWKAVAEKPQDQYSSWLNLAVQSASDRRELLSCLHQATIECLACEKAEIQPSQALLLNPIEVDSSVYATTKINVSPSGDLAAVEFASQAEEQQFLGQLATVGTTADGAAAQPLEAYEEAQTENGQAQHPTKLEVSYYTVTDETFLSSKLNLQNRLTFHILKRFSQLSGHRIPDPVLNSIVAGKQPTTLSHFLDRVYDTVVKPQPTSLAEILMKRQTLISIGNVMVLPRRETPVDKEKEVGRWKVIEKELKNRGLPVLGKLYS